MTFQVTHFDDLLQNFDNKAEAIEYAEKMADRSQLCHVISSDGKIVY